MAFVTWKLKPGITIKCFMLSRSSGKLKFWGDVGMNKSCSWKIDYMKWNIAITEYTRSIWSKRIKIQEIHNNGIFYCGNISKLFLLSLFVLPHLLFSLDFRYHDALSVGLESAHSKPHNCQIIYIYIYICVCVYIFKYPVSVQRDWVWIIIYIEYMMKII